MSNKYTDISKLTLDQLLDASFLIATRFRDDIYSHDWTGVKISNRKSFNDFANRVRDKNINNARSTLNKIGQAIKDLSK